MIVHCRRLAPVFQEIAIEYKGVKNTAFARMDLSEHRPADLDVKNCRFFFN